jgi:glutamate synthase domain-containing protein 2/glutamate synthase domain-containing protein 1/glutamate synthase domain-containing protein 3
MENNAQKQQGLYDRALDKDSCGVGFVADISGQKSRRIVELGLQVCHNLEHRGAVGADPLTGDGAGILLQLPDKFFRRTAAEAGIQLPPEGRYAVGFIYLPQNRTQRKAVETIIEKVTVDEGQEFLGWRDVPVQPEFTGEGARATLPCFRQCFIGASADIKDPLAFDRKLYLIRRVIDRRVRAEHKLDRSRYYVASFSCRTIIYKGMLLADQLPRFYVDLQAPDMESALALIHMRFSTNTFPTWDLAHPFRMIAHNGEINALRGNINWMAARQMVMESPLYGKDLKRMLPIIMEGQSDSATFDTVLELLVMAGRSMPHAMMMMVPEAWSKNPDMDQERRAFYEYHATMMEPWDGPAAIAFTDGTQIGATLDRNGLRPARYIVTKDNLVILASEAGTLAIEPSNIVRSGKLQPGKMFLIDLAEKRIIEDEEIKSRIIGQKTYRKWVEENMIRMSELPDPTFVHQPDHPTILERQRVFGYTSEDINSIIRPMAVTGEEAIGSMGVDASLAVLSDRPQPLFRYFKQLFAQVTNPPIDPIREELVMELTTYIGPEGNLLDETPSHAHRLELEHPVLTNNDLEKIRTIARGHFQAVTLNILFDPEAKSGMRNRLDQVCDEAANAVRSGVNLIILSDRGVGPNVAPIPSLLAVAAVHHFLIRAGLRTKTGIVLESGEPREVSHFALLLGYGANAVNPYLAFETLADLIEEGGLPEIKSFKDAKKHYIKAVGKGLFKIFSKMGISTLQSYCGAQIFEAVGLDSELINTYFTGTPSRVEGCSAEMLEEEVLRRHTLAYDQTFHPGLLDPGGLHYWRKEGETHLYSPSTIHKLQLATRTGDYKVFKEFSKLIDDQVKHRITLRSLLDFDTSGQAVPIDEVEPVTEILKRFATGAMSFGSISWEAHTTLAIAMNRIGGKSNTGEGGEDTIRYEKLENGDSMRSAIKQVASARFGVTTNYLVNADELQIKMAQGAKPGEGGQLPGHKVDKHIGKLRYSTPGVTLISPPPHHDIYSIEDLKQLIFDLKNVNPKARISVKLVSEVGVGTVAAGVAKCHADHILISGDSGGTGASPISSIHHAGTPWELGLAETHQTLVANGLRDRVVIATDGKLLTGRDVVIGALLGAEEFGFSTSALVTVGCIMMRKCHLNTCPVGVATQDPELRKKFAGKPEYVINFMTFLAQEVREIMAQLGFRKFHEMVGQVERLTFNRPHKHWKARGLDFSRILTKVKPNFPTELYCTKSQDHGLENQLDRELIERCKAALEKKEKVSFDITIRNTNRTVGAMLAGESAKRYGEAGLPDGTIHIRFRGVAGQSFGAFVNKGITLEIAGQVNDYVGKGLSGGRLIVRVPDGTTYDPAKNIIAGNTCFYGATGGEAYINGLAGERFAVRNSGANLVIEGLGDHGCEYMTGGRVVVLGKTGRNFAAGMSGGIAYVLDADGSFPRLVNPDMVDLEEPDARDEDEILQMVTRHKQYTGSLLAEFILGDWDRLRKKFVKVIPGDYKIALKKLEEEHQLLTEPTETRS